MNEAPVIALNYDAQTHETEPRTGSIEPEKRRDMPQTTGNKRLAQIRKIIERGAEAVVLSKGIWERLNVCPETFEILAKNGIKMEVLQTEAAVERFNELRESMPVGGLFHSTC